MADPLLAACIAVIVAAGPADLTFLTEDYPPENYVERGELKGLAVELLKAVWTELGVAEQPIEVLPWARAFHRTRSGPRQVLFATARLPEREALFKWAGPIHKARNSLFALPGRGLAVRGAADAARFRTGVLIQDACERLLVAEGVAPGRMVQVRSLTQLLKMLRAGRLDMVCTSEVALRREMRSRPEVAVGIERVADVGAFGTWFAFSPDVDDETVTRFQRALVAVEAERVAIIRRYGLTP